MRLIQEALKLVWTYSYFYKLYESGFWELQIIRLLKNVLPIPHPKCLWQLTLWVNFIICSMSSAALQTVLPCLKGEVKNRQRCGPFQCEVIHTRRRTIKSGGKCYISGTLCYSHMLFFTWWRLGL